MHIKIGDKMREIVEKEIKVLSQEEINRMLIQNEGIEQIRIIKKVGDNKFKCEITRLSEAELRKLKTEWKIDVWNCRGVLKKAVWGLGYGSTPDISPKGRYIDIGYFIIPIKKDADLTNEECGRLQELLFEIINRNGMINMSGFYPVEKEDIKRIKEIIGNKLYEGNGGRK